MKELIKELSEKYFDEIVSMRRYIHAHPELSYQEKNTSAFVAKRLSEWEIPYTENIGGFGIRAEITGYLSSKKSIALRGDMDALPITEDNDLPFKSTVDGVMHACGHDVHTASLLGAAKILNETKEHWGGVVTLVFQPAEEVLPGGALLMMNQTEFSVNMFFLNCLQEKWVIAQEPTWLQQTNFMLRLKEKADMARNQTNALILFSLLHTYLSHCSKWFQDGAIRKCLQFFPSGK